MRILYVVPGAPEDKTLLFVRRQIRSVVELGVQGEVFWLRSRTDPVRLGQALLDLRREERRFAPDLVHAQYGTMTAAVSALAVKSPLIVTFRGSDLNFARSQVTPVRSAMSIALSHGAAARADQIVCVSEGLAGQVWWVTPPPVVIPNGIALDVFRPHDRAVCRRQLGWGDEPVVVFNASTDPVLKGLNLAATAVEVARQRYPTLRFEVMQGKTPHEKVPSLLSAADVLVLASQQEGSPNIVREAMACNLPIVSVDVGDVRQQLTGTRQHRIVERDAGLMGAAIVDAIAEGVRSNGREKLAGRSERRVAEQLLSLYEETLRRHRARR